MALTVKSVKSHQIAIIVFVLVGTAIHPFISLLRVGHGKYQQGIQTSKTRLVYFPYGGLISQAAEVALKRIWSDSHESIFETNFSTITSVYTNGFPYAWSPCTLRRTRLSEFRAYQNNGTFRPLRISVLGGSSSAHTSRNCELDQGKFGGRYSNILERALNLDFSNLSHHSTKLFEINNVAHGATDSCWNSFFLDELLDINQTDVLVWEFAINDALGGTTCCKPRNQYHLAKLLNLWFWRVICMFEKAGRSVPPILMVYLWDSGVFQDDGVLGQSAFRNQRKVIEHYRKQGLSIGVVNAGGAIESIEGVKDPKKRVWLDDAHHPSCQGNHLIAGMLRHAIYSDLVSCTNSTFAAPTSNTYYTPMMNKRDTDPIYSYLIQNKVSIGSLMQWKPQSGVSRLRLTDGNQVWATEADHGAKASLTREDRKFSYIIPPCPNTTNFTLAEPKLEWLALGYGKVGVPKRRYEVRVHVQINGVVVDAPKSTDPNKLFPLDEYGYFSAWIHVPQFVDRSESYSLSLCKDVHVSFNPQLNWIIGVERI